MASLAAALISSGALKSGNPCARLTALCSMASRLISRITDSVKFAVRSLRNRSRESMTISREYSSLLGPVKSAVNVGVSDHDLDVIAGFGEGDRLDEFGGLFEGRIGQPVVHTRFARVVGGKGGLPLTVQLIQHHAEVKRTEFTDQVRLKQHLGREFADAQFTAKFTAGGGHHLRQSVR